MSSLTVEPILDSLVVVLALALLGLAMIFGVRPSGTDLSPRRTAWLVGLRLGALVLLVLALLRPTWVRTDNRPATATLAVLVDNSRSMTLTDGQGRSRWETQREVVERMAPRLGALDEALEVRYYAYGGAAEPVAPEALDQLLAASPDERATDLAAALRTAMTGTAGRPLAGVVMIGDGTSTVTGSNPAASARSLASLEVPLWTVPIGAAQGDDQLRDVAVEELPESYRVFSKNLFRVTATVRTRGMSGRDVPVQIRLIDAEESESEVAVRTVQPSAADDASLVDVELVAPEPGSYRLVVAVPPQPGETLTENNQQLAFLDVREGGGRLLYVEGEPRLEQLFLRRAIGESPDLELDVLPPISVDTQSRWPVNLGDATEPGRYDVYLIGDVDAAALGEENLRAIAERVEDGSGLLMIGGFHNFDAGGYADSPLADVLPIRMNPDLRVSVDQDPPDAATLEGPVTVRVTRPHPITRLGSARDGADAAGDSEASVWSVLKPLRGANRFGPPKVAPSVEVLLESDAEDPLLVVGQYGAGRTAAFAGDSTWQWWRQGQSEAHRRFWRQLMLWLLARDTPELDSAWVRMSSRRFSRDDGATFVAGVQTLSEGADRFPLEAEIVGPDGTRISVPTTAEAAGANARGEDPWISGEIPDLPAGLYTIRVSGAGEAAEGIESAEMLFQVLDLDAELSRPLADVSRMEQLAALTSEAGGEAFRADEVDRLLDRVAELRRHAELPVVDRFRLGDGPISGWLLMAGFVGLLSTEWYLRKRWGLV